MNGKRQKGKLYDEILIQQSQYKGGDGCTLVLVLFCAFLYCF